MDRNEKAEKKQRISEDIDLANGRFKDDEVDFLYDLVTRDSYDDLYHEDKNSFDSWCSEGKYHRDVTSTYRVVKDNDGLRVEKHYEYRDDDGQHGESDSLFTTAREIIGIFRDVFGR